jgi:rhodanese-related sulfurtransferase
MDFVQQNIWLVMLVAVSGGMFIASFIRGGKGISVTEATLLINREEALVVDVRETSEWSAGHIPNARHIALGQLDKRVGELDKFKGHPLIVCCASGNRSSSACNAFKKAGFERVFNLNGGIRAWSDAGLPVTTKG